MLHRSACLSYPSALEDTWSRGEKGEVGREGRREGRKERRREGGRKRERREGREEGTREGQRERGREGGGRDITMFRMAEVEIENVIKTFAALIRGYGVIL